MKTKAIGVRELAEFVGRTGSITNQFTLALRAIEGTKLHQKYQSIQNEGYQKEVNILTTLELFDYTVTLHGRIDGLYQEEEEVYIEEIKSTYIDLEEIEEATSPAHFYQLISYGYLYCYMYELKEIHLSLVYIHVISNDIKKLHYHYTIEELKEMFLTLFKAYYRFLKYQDDRLTIVHEALEKLDFPYANKREGQSKMMNAVYYTIKQKNKLFIQASTGLGKTLGVLYPALKAFHANYTNKILYLTAKSIARNVVLETIELLEKQDFPLNIVIINAKDRMCFLEKRDCNPAVCPYADHYFNKINEAIYDALTHARYFDEELVKRYATKYGICPFELSLDLFDFCDLAIMDYNYVFDPRVKLIRIFKEENHNTLLIDEAHNLVERSRDMFSCNLDYDALLKAKMVIENKSEKLDRLLNNLLMDFLKLRDQLAHLSALTLSMPPSDLVDHVSLFFNEAYDYLQEKGSEEDDFLEFFFECSKFRTIFDLYGPNYITYVEDGPLTIKLFCIDPTELLQMQYDQCTSTILFSATLLPITYFFSILGGYEQDKKLYFPSNFDLKNRRILIGKDIDTRYSVRKQSYSSIAQYIYRFSAKKKGNYLILFPSYEYMNTVYEMVKSTYDLKIYKQESNMTLEQRDDFLSLFKNNEETQIFFGILGGIFSEGIDFKGDLLIGCMIVGVGLPQLSLERDLIKDYFKDNGFDYSYRYPGFNKVLQGSGRVIRSEEDKGVILLLDDRYLSSAYTKLFPYEWQNCKITDLDHIEKDMLEFWEQFDEK